MHVSMCTMYMNACMHVSMCTVHLNVFVHVSMYAMCVPWCLQKLEEGVRSPGNAIGDGCDIPHWCHSGNWNLVPLKKQQVLLKAKPNLQPPPPDLENILFKNSITWHCLIKILVQGVENASKLNTYIHGIVKHFLKDQSECLSHFGYRKHSTHQRFVWELILSTWQI